MRYGWRALRGGAVLGTIALAGCGGGHGPKPPTAVEKRAALDRWVQRTDAACEQATRTVAARGYPKDVRVLRRAAARTAADIRRASATIERLPAPAGSQRRVEPFVQALRALDPVLGRVTTATRSMKPARIERSARELRPALREVEQRSKALGLRKCAAHGEHAWMPDALRAPVYAQQLAVQDRRIVRRVKRVLVPGFTTAEFDRLQGMIERRFDRADARYQRLYRSIGALPVRRGQRTAPGGDEQEKP